MRDLEICDQKKFFWQISRGLPILLLKIRIFKCHPDWETSLRGQAAMTAKALFIATLTGH